MITSCKHQEEELWGMQQERRSGDGRECRNARSGPANANQAAGSKREGKQKEERCEVLAHQEKQNLPQKLHEDWVEVLAESVERPGQWE